MLKRTLPTAALLLGAVALLAGPAVADEAWTTVNGNVEYVADVGTMAHLGVDDGAIFIEGLAGNTTNRGVFQGYWVSYAKQGDPNACSQPAYDEYDVESWSWGYVEMTFHDKAFPSRWTMTFTACEDPTIVGTVDGNPM